jgi:hypothetical protein
MTQYTWPAGGGAGHGCAVDRGTFSEPQTDEFFESHFPVRVHAEYGMGIYLFERVQP